MASNKSNKSQRKIHKIEVDREGCIGAATCVVLAPDAFELDKDNIAIVKEGALSVDDNNLLIAAQSCPTQAIILFDKDGNKVFP